MILLLLFAQQDLFMEHVELYVITGDNFESRCLRSELDRTWNHTEMDGISEQIRKRCTIIYVDSNNIRECYRHRVKRYGQTPRIRFGRAESPIVLDQQTFKCSGFPLRTVKVHVDQFFKPNVLRDFEEEVCRVELANDKFQKDAHVFIDRMPFGNEVKKNYYRVVNPIGLKWWERVCCDVKFNYTVEFRQYDLAKIQNDFDGFTVPELAMPVVPSFQFPWEE